MNIYFTIWLVMWALSGGVFMAKHGEPREPYNFGYWLIGAPVGLFLVVMAVHTGF